MTDEQDSTPEKAVDDFWTRVVIPVNYDWETNGLEFVNSVQVADMFASITHTSAYIAQQIEDVTGEIANIQFELDDAEAALRKFRRQILADNYAKFTKSASPEVTGAYILACAIMSGQGESLTELEKCVASHEREIRLRKPMQARLSARLKQLEKQMDFGKQYLDFDKLMKKIDQANKGRAV